jgi:hypothetical protein
MLTQKKYCIDYRNGSMGNTILAHILFSCDQVSINFTNFFSSNGHAHNISELNKTPLIAAHLVEHPNDKLSCVLQVITAGWDEILRVKMSYSKWYLDFPTVDNYQNFFKCDYSISANDLWKEFYNNIKDDSWPECMIFENYQGLPQAIKKEIDEKWITPKFNITSQQELLEFLTYCYYDKLKSIPVAMFTSPTYRLEDYINGNFDELIKIADALEWCWQESKSKQFYLAMLQNNKLYLAWLENFKKRYHNILNDQNIETNIETWELALILAKIFFDCKKNPKEVNWQNLNCFFNKKSLKLTQLIGL